MQHKHIRLGSVFPDMVQASGHPEVNRFLQQVQEAEEKITCWLEEVPENAKQDVALLHRIFWQQQLRPQADALRGKPITREEQRRRRYEVLNLVAETRARLGEVDWLYCAGEFSAREGKEISPKGLRNMYEAARRDVLRYIGIDRLREELARMDAYGHTSVVLIDARGDFVRLTREALELLAGTS